MAAVEIITRDLVAELLRNADLAGPAAVVTGLSVEVSADDQGKASIYCIPGNVAKVRLGRASLQYTIDVGVVVVRRLAESAREQMVDQMLELTDSVEQFFFGLSAIGESGEFAFSDLAESDSGRDPYDPDALSQFNTFMASCTPQFIYVRDL